MFLKSMRNCVSFAMCVCVCILLGCIDEPQKPGIGDAYGIIKKIII